MDCRFLELSGLAYAPEERDVVRLVTHNDVASRSSLLFNSDGAEVLNKISQGCRNSIVGNLLGGTAKDISFVSANCWFTKANAAVQF